MTKTRDLANLIADSKVGPSEIDTTGNYTIAQLDVNGTITSDGLTVGGNITLDEASAAAHGEATKLLTASGNGYYQDLRISANDYDFRYGPSAWNSAYSALQISSTGSVVFNESGQNADFRVESDTSSHALFVDASANVVGMGLSNPNSYYATDLVIAASNNGGITIRNTTDTTSTNYIMFADGDSGEDRYRGMIQYTHSDDRMVLHTNATSRLAMTESSVVFNEDGRDTDFRVESDTNANFLLLDASAEMLLVGGGSNTAGGAAFKVTQGNDGELTLDSTSSESNIVSYDRNGGGYHPLNIYGSNINFNPTSGNAAIFNEASLDADFRVETDSINDAFEIDASQNVIKFKTNVWQHAPLTGGFAGGWVTVTNLDTLSNLISNSAAKIRVYANENGRTNVSYSEHLAVRTNGTWVLQQLGEVTAGNSHGNANIQMSGTNLQIRNAASSSIGAWKVSLELFR